MSDRPPPRKAGSKSAPRKTDGVAGWIGFVVFAIVAGVVGAGVIGSTLALKAPVVHNGGDTPKPARIDNPKQPDPGPKPPVDRPTTPDPVPHPPPQPPVDPAHVSHVENPQDHPKTAGDDDINWERVKALGDRFAYMEYLEAFPHSSHIADVQKELYKPQPTFGTPKNYGFPTHDEDANRILAADATKALKDQQQRDKESRLQDEAIRRRMEANGARIDQLRAQTGALQSQVQNRPVTQLAIPDPTSAQIAANAGEIQALLDEQGRLRLLLKSGGGQISSADDIRSRIAANDARLKQIATEKPELVEKAAAPSGMKFGAKEEAQERLAANEKETVSLQSEQKRLTGLLEQNTDRDGRYAYGAPGVMQVAQPYFLSVAVTPLPDAAPETKTKVDAKLAQDVRDTVGDASAAIRSGDVKLGRRMKATLTGAGFDVTATSSEEQTVDDDVTRWVWQVQPRAAGKQPLVMKLIIKGENGQPDREARVVPAVVDVRSADDVFKSAQQMAATQTAGATQKASAGGSADQLAPRSAAPQAFAGLSAPSGAGPGKAVAASCKTSGDAGSKRFALVIANQDYTGVRPLGFALDDGHTVRDVLAESGFRVTACENLGADDMGPALAAFRNDVKKAADANRDPDAVFYYAGHGAALPGKTETYLLPVSLRQAEAGLIEAQGMPVDAVVAGLSAAGAKRVIYVFDACRDVLKLEGGGDFRGLDITGWRTAAFDIVAYATMWGEKARDNGFYAKSLAKWIRAMPGEDAAAVLNKVQTDVASETKDAQVPQYNDRMPGVFTLKNQAGKN